MATDPQLVLDNRDLHTTWLWLNTKEYVAVDPVDLLMNAIENLPPEEEAKLRFLYQALEML